MSSSEQTNPNLITQQQELDQGEEEVGKLAVWLANGVVLPMLLKSALELNLIEIISDAGTGRRFPLIFRDCGPAAHQEPGRAGSAGPDAKPLGELFHTQVLSRDQRERGG